MANCKMNLSGSRFPCSKKADHVGLAFYKSEGGESRVEVPMCSECAKRTVLRLKEVGRRIRVGILEFWSVQPLAYIASAPLKKAR